MYVIGKVEFGILFVDLKGKLATVVVHAARVHHAESVLDRNVVQYFLARQWTDASIRQCRSDHGSRVARHFNRTHLRDVTGSDAQNVNKLEEKLRSSKQVFCGLT